MDLIIFDDKLKLIHEMNNNEKSFELLNEDEIEDLLLEGEGALICNNKNNVISIAKIVK